MKLIILAIYLLISVASSQNEALPVCSDDNTSRFFQRDDLTPRCSALRQPGRRGAIRRRICERNSIDPTGVFGPVREVCPLTCDACPDADRVLTMWWILFNKPSACAARDPASLLPGDPVCSIEDVELNAIAGTNDPQIAILFATSGIPDENGFLRMVASVYRTQCALDLVSSSDNGQVLFGSPFEINVDSSIGYCPDGDEETEVHVFIRDHGPPTANQILQLTRFNDPSCVNEGGSNLCLDVGTTAFGEMDDGFANESIVGFPSFPVGCFASGDCSELQEAIQLRQGSAATLIRTGDGYQIVAEINAPLIL